MTSPRGRTAHVRPRPPSTGRPLRARDVRPANQRVRQHRGLDGRRRRLPLPTRLLLILSVLALGGAVFLTATGGIGTVVSSLGAGFGNALNRLIATPVPTEQVIIATGSPVINAPASPYTNASTVALKVIIPADAVGKPDTNLKIYLALQGLEPAPIQEIAIGSSQTLTISVELTKGRNDVTATVDRSGVESDPSPVVTVFLDQTPPKLSSLSPKNGSTVDDPNLTLTAKTEPKSTVIGRNDANGVSVTVTSADDGTFQLLLALAPGSNAIHVDVTDRAGNTSTTDLTYVQGSGTLTANLSASSYLISVSHPPGSLRVAVLVKDPTGAPLAGSSAFFTITLHGLAPISGSATTGADGRASFTTALVGKMTTGTGQVTVLVTDPTFGQASDRVALTFIK